MRVPCRWVGGWMVTTAGIERQPGRDKLYSVPSTYGGRPGLYTRLARLYPKALFGLWSGVVPAQDAIAVCGDDAPAHVKRACSAVVTPDTEGRLTVRAMTTSSGGHEEASYSFFSASSSSFASLVKHLGPPVTAHGEHPTGTHSFVLCLSPPPPFASPDYC